MFNFLKYSQIANSEKDLQFICQTCKKVCSYSIARIKCSNCGNKNFKVAEFRFQGPKFETYYTDRGKPENLYNLDWNNEDTGWKMTTPGSIGFQNSFSQDGEQGNMGESIYGPTRRDTENDQFSQSNSYPKEDLLMDDVKWLNSDISSDKLMGTNDSLTGDKGTPEPSLNPAKKNKLDSKQNNRVPVDKNYKGNSIYDRIREHLKRNSLYAQND